MAHESSTPIKLPQPLVLILRQPRVPPIFSPPVNWELIPQPVNYRKTLPLKPVKPLKMSRQSLKPLAALCKTL